MLAIDEALSPSAESFTAMILGRGRVLPRLDGFSPGSVGWTHYVGVVVAADGDVIHTSGRVDSKREAWDSIEAFLLGWRVRGYPPCDSAYSAGV